MAYPTHNGAVPSTSNNGTDFVTNIRKNQQAIRDAVILGSFPGWNYSIPGCSVTGSISGSTLTVTGITSGLVIPNLTISGTGITVGTKISSQLTSTETNTAIKFGKGTYSISIPHGTVASTTVTGISADASAPAGTLYTRSTLEKLMQLFTFDGSGNCTKANYWYWSSTDDYSTAIIQNVWYNLGTEDNTFDGSGNCTASTWTNVP